MLVKIPKAKDPALSPPSSLPRLHTVICSTRPGRIGPAIARWFHGAAAAHGGFDAALVDLADFKLPVYDEPHHPRLKQYQHAHSKAWSASVDAADAFVFVTPEYNHGPTPALINALNYLYHEWANKPASFVSYGGVSAGLRGTQLCKPILNALHMVPIAGYVPIPMVRSHLAGDGSFTANDVHAVSARTMLDELLKWHGALKTLRVAG
jgi:NAD(P)H-dependent FMN reductase